MRLAFYRASNGDLLDKAVNVFSGFGGFSHIELVFSDGVCFSSTVRDDWAGVDECGAFTRTDGLRFKQIEFDAGKWAFYNLPFGPDQEADIRANARDMCADRKARYDYWGVLAFVNPFAKESPARWFCSESNIAALRLPSKYQSAESVARVLKNILRINPDTPSHKLSPNGIAKLLEIH